MRTQPFTKKTVILFDWNRTLVDTSRAFDTAFIHVLKEYTARSDPPAPGWDPVSLLGVYKAEMGRYKRQGAKAVTDEQAVLNSLKRAFQGLPLPSDRKGLAAIHQLIRQEQERRCVPLPGTVEVLKKLSKTHTLAVISNSEKVDLKRAGLSDWISPDRCFTAAKAGSRKPSPGIFHYALGKLKTPPSDCVMVGNSWRTDIRGAERARIDAVWIHKKAKRKLSILKYGDIRVAVIRGLPRLLQLLYGK